ESVVGLVTRIELEALFGDGYRLIVLHDPITRRGPPLPEGDAMSPAWLEGSVPLLVTNEGDVPIALTSHFHVFEANRRLRFDRRRARLPRCLSPPACGWATATCGSLPRAMTPPAATRSSPAGETRCAMGWAFAPNAAGSRSPWSEDSCSTPCWGCGRPRSASA